MANDIGTAQLTIVADGSGVEIGVGNAKKSLADLGATAAAAGKQASDGLAKAGDGGKDAADKVDRSTQSIITSIQRTTATLEAGSKGTSAYFQALANQRGVDPNVLKPFLDQLDVAAAKAKVAASATKDIAGAVGTQIRAEGIASAAHEMEGFSFKTAAAKRELLVLGHELSQGNFSRFGGSLLVLAERTGAAALLFNPLTLGILGATAALAGLAKIFIDGAEEATAFNKAIILSGNAAGVTEGQLAGMSVAISRVAGTQGNAAAAVAAFAQSGAVAGANLEKVSLAAIKFERDTGQAIGDTVKQFGELAKAPVEASVKLNDSLHYLTLSTYSQIKALEDQGKATEAASLAQRAYADAIDSRSGQIEAKLGSIERAWLGIKNATKEALDAALSVGRAASLQDQLVAVRQRLAQSGRSGAGGLSSQIDTNPRSSTFGTSPLQAAKDLEASLVRRIALESGLAEAAKKASDQVAARIKFDKDGEQFISNAVKTEREIAKARSEGAAAGATQAEIEQRIADIRAKYAPKARSPFQIDKAQLSSDLDAIKSASDQIVGIYGNAEKITEAMHAAGALSDAEYYEGRREQIRATAAVQEDALQKEIARRERENLSGKDAIDNQKKIVELQAQAAILAGNTAAKLTVLDTQQETATKKLALAYLSARQAAQDYFDSVNKQQSRALSGVGAGNQARSFNAGVNQIEDRYANQRLTLENQKAQLLLEQDNKLTDAQQAQLDQRLRLINEFQDESIASYRDYYAKLQQLQGDAGLGAQEALKNYFDESQQFGKQSESVVGKAFKGMEDSLVGFVTTGKSSFKSLADSIAADIIRITIKQQLLGPLANALGGGGLGGLFSSGSVSSGSDTGWLGSLAGLVGSFFGGGSGEGIGSTAAGGIGSYFGSAGSLGGGRAMGGPVTAGGLYQVNENGPELLTVGDKQYLMMGSNAGTVTPNGGSSSGKAPVHVTINQNFPQNASRQTVNQAAMQAAMVLKRTQRDV